ncbi:DNA-binding protein [Bradyrhizobium sp. JYMT SZCCT0428]|uniref:helix-turn-helix domain-containing transcriptional regulator n=1 Tax=Bradyrhizobium sp. JYMT SZCCT0428 TaxID=2807673 RepID=UPI003908B66C
MKKIVLALAAVAAITGSASAADLGARPYTKAPPPVAPVYNWTGFYIFGGGGGGIWSANGGVDVTGGPCSHLAQKSGIARTSIHRAFARDPQKPNFTTILRVLDAMGFQLHITIRREQSA